MCLHSLNGRVKDRERGRGPVRRHGTARGTGMGRAAATADNYFV